MIFVCCNILFRNEISAETIETLLCQLRKVTSYELQSPSDFKITF